MERPFDFLIAAAANCGLLPLSWRHGVIPAWLNSRAISERRGLPPIRGSKRGNVVRLDLDALRAARKDTAAPSWPMRSRTGDDFTGRHPDKLLFLRVLCVRVSCLRRSDRSDRNLFRSRGFRIVDVDLIANRRRNGPDTNFHRGSLFVDGSLIADCRRNCPDANFIVLLAKVQKRLLIRFGAISIHCYSPSNRCFTSCQKGSVAL